MARPHSLEREFDPDEMPFMTMLEPEWLEPPKGMCTFCHVEPIYKRTPKSKITGEPRTLCKECWWEDEKA